MQLDSLWTLPLYESTATPEEAFECALNLLDSLDAPDDSLDSLEQHEAFASTLSATEHTLLSCSQLISACATDTLITMRERFLHESGGGN